MNCILATEGNNKMVVIERKNVLCKRVVFVDGMWGTGKSILAPVMGSFENIEKQKIDSNFEYVCIISEYSKVESKSAATLIQLMSDVAIFKSMISREVNLRPGDDTGILNNPHGWTYLRRLFTPGDNNVIKKIQRDKIILQIMSHNILQVSSLLFSTFGTGLSLVVMARHPVYMLEHWFNYIERVGTDPREFTVATKNGGLIPWFANGINDYLALPVMDKVIFSIHALTDMQNKAIKMMKSEERQRILIIPFESFVTEPKPEIRKMEQLLRTKSTLLTLKILKKQKCPRERIHDGKGHKHYGFDRKTTKLSEEEDYERRCKFIRKNASSEALKVLNDLANNYKTNYVFPKEMPWEKFAGF